VEYLEEDKVITGYTLLSGVLDPDPVGSLIIWYPYPSLVYTKLGNSCEQVCQEVCEFIEETYISQKLRKVGVSNHILFTNKQILTTCSYQSGLQKYRVGSGSSTRNFNSKQSVGSGYGRIQNYLQDPDPQL